MAALLLGGCSTPGPLHLYSIGPDTAEVHDLAVSGDDTVRATPDFVAPDELLTGFAYDPYTDHFFLRLAPGNRIRVVDRPARRIKREFVIAGLPDTGGGDLAVCPRDGHLFLVDPTAPVVFESTRLGQLLRSIHLAGMTEPPAAIALDAATEHLLVLGGDGRTVRMFDRGGAGIGTFSLPVSVAPSVAFDADRRQLYAPLRGAVGTIGVFDERGRQIRTLAVAPHDRFIDVGPHSFLRVF